MVLLSPDAAAPASASAPPPPAPLLMIDPQQQQQQFAVEADLAITSSALHPHHRWLLIKPQNNSS
jgi:hypothetical protein